MPAKNIVVLGAGAIGRRHIELIEANSRCRLEAVVDRDPDAAACGAPLLPDVAALRQKHRPDGIIIATPTGLHAEHAEACLACGVPLLIEKPVAGDLAAAAAIEDAARKAGVPVLVGQVRRHSPAVARAKQALDEGALGELVAVSAVWALHKPPAYFDSAWRQGKDSGPLLTNAIHDIDALRHLAGDIEEVQALGGGRRRGGANEEAAALALRFATGAVGTLLVADGAAAPWSWELTAADRTSFEHASTGQDCYHLCGAEAALGLPSLRLWRHAGAPDWTAPMACETLAAGTGSGLERQLDHFLDVIEGRCAPLVDVADASRSLAAVLQALAACRPPAA
ncbi:MAG: Gfo/Idh/MocA family oxidoreductase [Betaproteobacteria bacterium AqS2]|uniref:Gfo/Idh/MocA family oxidoreductase n=1 Tax=Candidatus Amphirhobacter heronislandensis TaxID=1732024 RepID=A0A930UGR2_9GAMM|nr:Gfo/Idh/MocA family oxidoreductase [Betaproteobacteria bacterium AqS2]